MYLRNCRFDFDANRVEAMLSDGSRLSIDCIAVENELAETWLDRRELDFLIYNEPESYVELILTGRAMFRQAHFLQRCSRWRDGCHQR